jgi:dihydropyrimidinase
MENLLIKHGLVVTEDDVILGDILVKQGKIHQIGQSLDFESVKIIDASGKYVIPGGVDPHVHFHLPTPSGFSCDDFLSGSRAAISGGTTTFIDFVTPHRTQNYDEAVQQRLSESVPSVADYLLHFSPVRWDSNSEKEIFDLSKKYGIRSFKVYLAYKNNIGIEDGVLLNIMDCVAKLDGILAVHCENDEIIRFLQQKFVREGKISPLYHALSRPAEAEIEAISKIVNFAKITGCRVYIVHVSTRQGVELVRQAKKDGLPIFAETCPHYLLFTESVYHQLFEQAVQFVFSPVLKSVTDQEALWEGLRDGTLDVVATDHCPFNLRGQKDIYPDFTKIPNGTGGVEFRLQLLYTFGVLTNRLSINQWAKLCCQNPAEIFCVNGKGKIKLGYDADLVIWNPNFEGMISAKEQFQCCDHTIYEGISVKGQAEMVVQRGEIVYANRKFDDKRGKGRFLGIMGTDVK